MSSIRRENQQYRPDNEILAQVSKIRNPTSGQRYVAGEGKEVSLTGRFFKARENNEGRLSTPLKAFPTHSYG